MASTLHFDEPKECIAWKYFRLISRSEDPVFLVHRSKTEPQIKFDKTAIALHKSNHTKDVTGGQSLVPAVLRFFKDQPSDKPPRSFDILK